MTKPLAVPQRAPVATPTGIAAAGGSPACKAIAVVTPDRAMTEPTLKSIPPLIMTNVMPRAQVPVMTVCTATFFRLADVRNASGRRT